MNHPGLRCTGCGSHDSMLVENSTRGLNQRSDEPNDTTRSARPVVERFIKSRPLARPKRSESSTATSVDLTSLGSLGNLGSDQPVGSPFGEHGSVPDVSRTQGSSISHVSQSETCVRHYLTRTLGILDHRSPGLDQYPGSRSATRISALRVRK